MAARDANIPIFLWVATAALVHILWGGGADKVVEVIESRTTLRRFAERVMHEVQQRNRSVEIALLELPEEGELDSQPAEPLDESSEVAEEPPASDEQNPLDEQNRSDEAQPAEPDTPPEAEKAEEKPPEPKPPEAKAEEPKAELQVLPDALRRISVQQHVKDKNQPDNPNAEFIADEANHVKQQTQARITSADQNAPDPNPGSHHESALDDPGNSHVTEVAQSDELPGDPTKAPAESEKDGHDKQLEQAAATEHAGSLLGGEPAKASDGHDEAGHQHHEKPSPGQQARLAEQGQEASPDLIHGEHGQAVAPHAEARDATLARKAVRQKEAKPGTRRSTDLRGFGSLNTTPGGLNPNLNPAMALSVIGQDQLHRERRADGERRRSKHRGSWRTVGLERWRSAIENYVASVQPGNQTALNTARVPFAAYLHRIHNRLHPFFAEDFLWSLDELPRDHPLNREDMKTFLEIVLSREDGRVVRMGVTRASGNTAFDVGALESVRRAAPFGAPPPEIVSPDGNVYLHWEFHRIPRTACTTHNAKPYLLRFAPTPAPDPDIKPPAAPDDLPAEPSRHGRGEPTGGEKRKDG